MSSRVNKTPYSLPTEEMAKQQILSTLAGPIQDQINNVNSIKHNPLLLLFLIYKTLLGFKCSLVDKRTLTTFLQPADRRKVLQNIN